MKSNNTRITFVKPLEAKIKAGDLSCLTNEEWFYISGRMMDKLIKIVTSETKLRFKNPVHEEPFLTRAVGATPNIKRFKKVIEESYLQRFKSVLETKPRPLFQTLVNAWRSYQIDDKILSEKYLEWYVLGTIYVG
jgi:hypothetical protein